MPLRSITVVVAAVSLGALTSAQIDWPSDDGDANGNRYSPITLIGKNNAARLAPKWIYSMENCCGKPRWPTIARTTGRLRRR